MQARYHHVLVDEFQDTSRLQWRLVELLIDAWGEGEGIAEAPTSIFVVGDRKQSIYRFRHAEVTLLDEAARRIGALRGRRGVRQAITASFRAVPELLAFVNATAHELQSTQDLDERFTYGEADRFDIPAVAAGALRDGQPVLGVIASPSMAESGGGGAPRGPTTSRSCSARVPGTSTSKRRSNRAASGRTSTRASASSMRRRSRISRPCCASWRSPNRTCAPPSSSGPGSCASRTPR
jgi:hypothetical protein